MIPVPAPSISAEALDETGFSISFSSLPGISYFLERTSDLTTPVTWQPVTSVYSLGGVLRLTDSTPTNTIQFYRLRAR